MISSNGKLETTQSVLTNAILTWLVSLDSNGANKALVVTRGKHLSQHMHLLFLIGLDSRMNKIFVEFNIT
jgi:hypothetical protein